jgi:hypothetical protein
MGLAIRLIWLVLFAFFVVRGGEDTERKLINVLIIASSAMLGVGITVLIEYLDDSPAEIAFPMGLVAANVGCLIAGAWNYWRAGGIYKGKKGKGMKSDKTVV